MHVLEKELGRGLEQELDIASEAVPRTIASKEDYVKRFLAMCVSHEMGHCLGLRHNFADSTNLTTAQLGDDKLTSERGDQRKRDGLHAAQRHGRSEGQRQLLLADGRGLRYLGDQVRLYADRRQDAFGRKICTVSGSEPVELAQACIYPDENVDRWDPYAVKFDGAKDPLQFSDRVVLSLRRARQYAIQNLPKPGQSYSTRTLLIPGRS